MALGLLWQSAAAAAPSTGEIKSTVRYTTQGGSYSTFEFDFGGGAGKNSQKAEFLISLGYPSILAGQKSAVGWGVECAVENGCKILSEEERLFFFFYKQLYAKKAATRISSPAFAPLKVNRVSLLPGVPRQDAQVEMVTRADKWNHGDAGVLGLAPFGSFINTLRNSYTDNLSLLLYFKFISKNPSKPHFSERLFVNPNFPAENLLVTVPQKDGDEFWTVRADMTVGAKQDPEWGFQNQPLCLSTHGHDILLTFDRGVRCNAIRKMICNGRGGAHCTTDKADFSKAPELVFKIGGIEFKFNHTEYLYPGENRIVECRFGPIKASRTSQICHPDSQYGIGKLFFEKYPLIINFTRNERPSVTFLRRFRPPATGGMLSARTISLLIVGTIVLTALIALVYIRKVRSDNRKYPDYTAISNKSIV